MYVFLTIHLHSHIFQRLKQVFQPPQPKKNLWSVPSKIRAVFGGGGWSPISSKSSGEAKAWKGSSSQAGSTGRPVVKISNVWEDTFDNGVFIEHTTINIIQKTEYISLQPHVHSAHKYMVYKYTNNLYNWYVRISIFIPTNDLKNITTMNWLMMNELKQQLPIYSGSPETKIPISPSNRLKLPLSPPHTICIIHQKIGTQIFNMDKHGR